MPPRWVAIEYRGIIYNEKKSRLELNEMISHPQPYKQTRHTQTGKQQDTYRDTEGTGRGNLECYRTFHVKTDIVEDRKSAIEQKLIRKTYDNEIKKEK